MKPLKVPILARFFVLLLGGYAALAAAGDFAETEVFGRTYHLLFTIHRSLNANELVYEAMSDAKGFCPDEPIKAYWIMKAKGGRQEPLTGMERRWAYGVMVKSVSAEEIHFSLRALPNRDITVRHTKEGASAVTLVDGEESVLKQIYIQSKGGGLIPTVDYADVTAVSLKTGKPRTERVRGKNGSD